MQIIVGVVLILSYFVSILGITYSRWFSLYSSSFLYSLAFSASIVSFGVATTLANYGSFRDIDFSTNSILFFFIVPSVIHSIRTGRYLKRLLALTGEINVDSL